ncbi:MAG: FAD-dependent monooxygenase [Sterolibacteriaceae bacterium]|nr:FAD-dependent monooxygenase [Sterolibacteriaceae bacterium]MBK9086347.1 FAD-dependent monooxygenase [Sterolibacteriaceae bacterium]
MQHSDILIVGAGPTGMALAVALAQAGRQPRIVDARTANAAQGDKRILALSHGSQQILDRLGVWRDIEATPIRTIHVSQQGGFGRTLLHAADYGVPALGYVVAASSLVAALARRLDALGAAVDHECEVTNLAAGAADVLVSHSKADAAPLCARLVALAEGTVSAEDDRAVTARDYRQHAVICTARPAALHGGIAYERFTPHGPLALLPFGPDYAVVFTAPADASDALLGLDESAFLAELQRSIGSRVRLISASARARYPLLLRYRREPVGRRTVWLGNAAQTLHPVAGQGFNLALRDVWGLTETLASAGPDDDPGAVTLLERYARARRLDRIGAIGFTDTLIRVFSNEQGLWRAARGGGLAVLDLLPPLKHFVAKRMMFGARAWP